MNETMPFPPAPAETASPARRTPTIYFIDDSATMREVIKIAFRRENITVIMPDQDGYSVCSQIKQHPQFNATPVILMSGVVNKNVADKAVSVGADELIRKPFQPQELIARVKSFLAPKSEKSPATNPVPVIPSAAPSPHSSPVASLSSLFAAPPATPIVPMPVAHSESRAESAWPRALSDAFTPQPHDAPVSQPQQHGAPLSYAPSHNFNVASPNRPPANATDIQKLRTEISRLELLIKKLQTELQIERQYNQALELHVKSLTSLD